MVMECCSKDRLIDIKKCPFCGDEGTIVKNITPKSILKDNIVGLISDEKSYRYCKNKNCDISYFAEDQNFHVADMKVKATHKDNGLDVHVCYCFNYTRDMILKDIMNNGKSNALKEIKDKMKDPGCFCEISNPQGSCCLGNVSAWIREIE